MKREIAPEQYNYNKYPGPSFARVGDKVVAEGIELDLVEDYKEAFDQTAFGQRFSQLMLKFDYIVGDWGNEQLRLKGFYKDDKPVKSDAKIGRLEDYLLEFCNFGCAYFVLANPNPQDLPVEVEDRPRPKRKRSRRRKPSGTTSKKEAGQQKSHSFTLHQKDAGKKPAGDKKKQTKKKPKKSVQDQKRGFVIRQK